MFFFKSYVAFYGYVSRPGTDRIPVEKVPPEQKKTESGGFLQEYAT